jgi:hypothetical protein
VLDHPYDVGASEVIDDHALHRVLFVRCVGHDRTIRLPA